MIDGKKSGKFSISVFILKARSTFYNRTNYYNGTIYLGVDGNYYKYYMAKGEDVVTGNYVNSQFNGIINFLTFIDLDSKEGFVNLTYENGKIADQVLKYPNVAKSTQLRFVPGIRFEAGEVKESIYIDNTFVTYKESIGKEKFLIMRCSSGYMTFEYFIAKKINNSDQYEIDGNYRTFSSKDASSAASFFDTTSTPVISFNYINGVKIGKQTINSFINGKPTRQEFNCENGLISGQSKYFIDNKLSRLEEYLNGELNVVSTEFFEDGKIAIEANYVKGKLSGFVKSYYNSESSLNGSKFYDIEIKTLSKNPISLITKNAQGLRNIYLKKIISKGGKINASDTTGYFLCLSSYYDCDNSTGYSKFNGDKLDYLYGSGKIMAQIIGGKNADSFWFDSNGKKIGSLSGELNDKQRVEEAINNTKIRCHWCNSEMTFGSSIPLDYCNCKQSDGSKIGLYINTKYFCSQKCRSQSEEDNCKKRGYNY
jgi:antitoxin component YwqK of YwqJK toxin-antitoxin module